MINNLKRTTKEIAEYFAEQGCELLGEYTGVMNKMKYRCSCGRMSEISWNNFTAGKRCGCGSKIRTRYSIESIRNLLANEGMVLLSTERKSHDQPLKYLCKCGKIIIKPLGKILHDGKHCSECAHKIMGMKRRNPNRPLERKFKKKMYKALQTCLQAMGKDKAGHTADLLGYGPKDLFARITKHPDWDIVKNSIWHMDHIFPIQAFIHHKIYDLKLINCLENLRPMNGKDNDSKHNKYNLEDFRFWLATKNITI
jgi:DNA-directed RNA polymerase subunit RPC12/RpoP